MREASAKSTAAANRPMFRSAAIILFFALLVAGVTSITFLGSIKNGFVNWDDPETIVDNPHIRTLNRTNLCWMFTTVHLGPYQPLSWLSLAVDYSLHGLDPRGFHLTSLLLHMATAVGVFFLSRRILSLARPGRESIDASVAACAALAALLFAIHPLRVESVVWATERRDVLSGLFAVWATWTYLRAVAAVGAPSGAMPSRVWLAASSLCFLLSLLSKASALALPAVFVVLDVYPLGRLSRNWTDWFGGNAQRVWLEKLPFVAASAVIGVVAVLGQRVAGALSTLSGVGPLDRLVIAGHATTFYVVKSLVPVRLSPFYELPNSERLWSLLHLSGGLASVVITVVVWLIRRRAPAAVSAWCSYLLLLAPVSGLAQSGQQIAADRYTYLPCIAFAVLVGGVAMRLAPARQSAGMAIGFVPVSLVLAAMLVLGPLTWRQSKLWRDSETLWQHAVSRDPASSWSLGNLARAKIERGELDLAHAYLTKAVRLRPDNYDAQNNLGVVYRRLGDPVAAKRHYDEALRLRPQSPQFAFNLGLLLSDPKRLEGLGFATSAEQWRAAAAMFERALSIQPDDARTLYQLSWLLATAPEPASRDGVQAVKLAERLQELPAGKNAESLDALAAAYAEVGRLEDAVHTSQRAASLADEQGRAELASQIRARTDSYRAGRPYRSSR